MKHRQQNHPKAIAIRQTVFWISIHLVHFVLEPRHAIQAAILDLTKPTMGPILLYKKAVIAYMSGEAWRNVLTAGSSECREMTTILHDISRRIGSEESLRDSRCRGSAFPNTTIAALSSANNK